MLHELKSATLVRRVYRSKFNGKSVQLKERYWKSLKNSIEPEQYLICLQNSRKCDRPELGWKFCSPKIHHYQSVKHQLMSVFRILFAVIYFLKIYASNLTNIKVLTNYCHLITKKGFFLLNGG